MSRYRSEDGFLMAALLVAMTVMAIAMGAALPAWNTAARREKEAELIFRGEQYGRAIGGFQRKYGNSAPPTVDVLVTERFLRKKYKDPVTGDDFYFVTQNAAVPGSSSVPGPPTGGTGAQTGTSPGRASGAGSGSATTTTGGRTGQASTQTSATTPGSTTPGGTTAGIVAVQSKSREKSLRLYNGLDRYNEWIFMGTQVSSTAGGAGGQAGGGARGGAAGGRGGQGAGGRGQGQGGGGGGGRGGGGGGRGGGGGGRGGGGGGRGGGN